MDSLQRNLEDRLVRLGEAIREALEGEGHDQQWLADRLDIHNSQVSRILSGKVLEISIERVRQIEDALGRKPGELLRAAGYVQLDGLSVREMLQSDPSLEAEDRATVLRVYDALAAKAAGASSARSEGSLRSAPVAPKRRRS